MEDTDFGTKPSLDEAQLSKELADKKVFIESLELQLQTLPRVRYGIIDSRLEFFLDYFGKTAQLFDQQPEIEQY